MLHCFDPIRDMTFWAILARLTLAVVCGGLIGAEREIKRRPAGFRTHILICLGSAITTLTSQYLLFQHLYNDIARLGAQVISGIGFVGAGTIIVTRDQARQGSDHRPPDSGPRPSSALSAARATSSVPSSPRPSCCWSRWCSCG